MSRAWRTSERARAAYTRGSACTVTLAIQGIHCGMSPLLSHIEKARERGTPFASTRALVRRRCQSIVARAGGAPARTRYLATLRMSVQVPSSAKRAAFARCCRARPVTFSRPAAAARSCRRAAGLAWWRAESGDCYRACESAAGRFSQPYRIGAAGRRAHTRESKKRPCVRETVDKLSSRAR